MKMVKNVAIVATLASLFAFASCGTTKAVETTVPAATETTTSEATTTTAESEEAVEAAVEVTADAVN